MPTKPYPEAPAFLKPVRDGIGLRARIVNLWVIERCPYCGKRHTHGGGVDGVDDPRRFLGHRVAHCSTNEPNPGYVLVERAEPTGCPSGGPAVGVCVRIDANGYALRRLPSGTWQVTPPSGTGYAVDPASRACAACPHTRARGHRRSCKHIRTLWAILRLLPRLGEGSP